MNNKYLAIVLSIVAVIVVVYQIFFRKPIDSIRQQLNQTQQEQPMFSTNSSSRQEVQGVENNNSFNKINTADSNEPASMSSNQNQDKNDDGLIIDYSSELLLKRIDPKLVVPYIRKELPSEFGQPIFTSGKYGDTTVKAQVEKEVEFRLNAIIIDETRRITIINDKILKPGDTILGAEVIVIAKSKVLLKVRGEEFVLSTNSRVKRVRLLGDNEE